jgi:hypothetical protein
MLRLRVLLLIALLGGPAAAEQAGTEPAPAQAAAAAPSELDRVVCRSGEPISGTRFKGPRQCKTQREWEEIRMRARHDLAKMQVRGCSSGSCN